MSHTLLDDVNIVIDTGSTLSLISADIVNKLNLPRQHTREPLNQLLKKDKQWHWTAECQEAFELLKNKLVTKPVSQLYDPKLPLHVFCNASQVAIGAILKQPDSSGNLHPVSYHSRTLRSYEKNYCITELECLAIVDALDKFYYYLHGKKFIIHTDHAALVWLKNVKNLRGRLFLWSLKLSMFDYEVKYLKRTANVEADMLSRHPTAQYIQHSVHLLELDEIKTHQNSENLYYSKYKKINDVLVLKKKNLFKIVVPFSLRRKVLQNAHEQFGHPGTQKMINLITTQYYWPHINQDISVFVKHCDVCQLNKKKRQKRFGLFQTVPPTDRPFEYLSIDTVGGFNYYNSTKKYLHLVIDHATRYVWAFPSKTETTETYANCLKQVFQIQVPTKLLSDRNGAFASSKFKRFLRNYSVKHLLTSSHHPQTNGKCERVNQSIVTKLKCKVNSSSTKTPWTKLLEQVINEYNLTPHSVTKFPPAYLLFGTLPYSPPLTQNQIYPSVEEARKLAKQNTIKYHDKN
ncbi:Transposon Tf2-6 polyprotein [Araneus ventricosus]|uniref:RNA-directed DNA polymerase n=1 Tax=Araneus ventricosus TaxID=182803 RepID=A0A4Y2VP35_ARAVE|nr:Transposon Tf2-6 polyprotein [Araneus ventricosus]